jgi:hypothetical protein
MFIISVVQIFKMEEMLHVLMYNIAEEVEEQSFTYMKYKWLTCVHGRSNRNTLRKIQYFLFNWAEHSLYLIYFLNQGIGSVCFIKSVINCIPGSIRK